MQVFPSRYVGLLLALGVGLVLALVLTAANLYLGLYAGMTVSASIPAAVLGLGLYRALGRRTRRDVHGVNLVQTLASSGESMAAGALFTLPSLVIAGVWSRFSFWPSFLMVASGGLLGIVLMVPLRRKLMEDKKLKFPEGVACAEVLRAGMGLGGEGEKVVRAEGSKSRASKTGAAAVETAGAGTANTGSSLRDLLWGGMAGAAFKLMTGMAWLSATVEGAWRTGRGVAYAGMDASLALVAVGYLTGARVALQVFAGGLFAWGLLPWVAHLLPGAGGGASGVATVGTGAMAPLDIAWGSWSKHLRYLGAGVMVVAGLWSLLGTLPMVIGVMRSMRGSLGGGGRAGVAGLERRVENPAEEDLRGPLWWGLLLLALACVLGLYLQVLNSVALAVLATGLVAVACFVWVAVSSHIVGLVGSSNNPVSGMTLSALLATALLLLLAGFRGNAGVTATLVVAAVVCCAACAAADCSQDLKTGHLLGTPPKWQQLFEVVGAIVPALLIAPVLNLLHMAYGIGATGSALKAPQATLFASLAQGVFGEGQLPMRWMVAGLACGLVLVALAHACKRGWAAPWAAKRGIEVHPMAVAVGMYLPFSLSVPIALGGLAHAWWARREAGGEAGTEVTVGNTHVTSAVSAPGTLFASGLVAGEALTGVALALLVYFEVRFWAAPWSGAQGVAPYITAGLTLAGVGAAVWFLARRRS
jgi:putative OPT family oligopeptide transporter